MTRVYLFCNFDPLQTALGKECASSYPTILLMDTEPEVAVLLPKVGIEEAVIQFCVGSGSGMNAGVSEGRVHRKTAYDENKVFIDGAIGCSAGIKLMGTSIIFSGRVCLPGVRM